MVRFVDLKPPEAGSTRESSSEALLFFLSFPPPSISSSSSSSSTTTTTANCIHLPRKKRLRVMFLGLVRNDVPWHYLMGTTHKCHACQRISSSEDRSMSSAMAVLAELVGSRAGRKIRRFLAHAYFLCRFRSIFFAPVAGRAVRWCFQDLGESFLSLFGQEGDVGFVSGFGMDALVTVCSWNKNGIMISAWML